MRILAIETSCDETAASVVSFDDGTLSVIANVVSSQIRMHAAWGGVVPQLAAREHIRNIAPVIGETLTEAALSPDDIDLIAVTAGPGLIPALTIGTQAAKTLAYMWKKSLLGIHHIEGHIYANFIGVNSNDQVPTCLTDEQVSNQLNLTPLPRQNDTVGLTSSVEARGSSIQFPLLALVVSGGHTQLVLMRDHFQYEILGETQDDAAGEAFDKVAKIVGLPYPGGPQVAAQALEWESTIKNPDATRTSTDKQAPNGERIAKIKLPRPMLDSGDFSFSFSGLKTAVLYTLRDHQKLASNGVLPAQAPSATTTSAAGQSSAVSPEFVRELCYEFQEAVVDVLTQKTRRAIEMYAPKTVVIAGGVSANVRLRESLRDLVGAHFPETTYTMPEFKYSLDNAAMIGAAAAWRWHMMSEEARQQALTAWQTIEPDANFKLETMYTKS